MRLMITGATGFIGRNLIETLSRANIDMEVLIPCRDIKSANLFFCDLGFENLKIIKSDDWNSIKEFNPNAVIHLASYSTSKNDEDAISKLIDSNIMYGVRLLNALKDCSDMRLFVNTGSFAEYRKGPRSINNAYLYSATKSAFRPILDYYANLSGYKYITMVPYSVYGGKSDVKRIFDYIIEAIDAKEPVGMSAGDQILDFIHVDDVCSFIISAITDLKSFQKFKQGKEFHLGTGVGHSIKDAASMVEEIIGKKLNIRWGAIPYRERDTMYSVAPVNMNDNIWRANIDLKKGLQKYLKQNGL